MDGRSQEQTNADEIDRLRLHYHDLANRLQAIALESGMMKIQLTQLQTELLERQRTFRWVIGVAIAAGPTLAVVVSHALHG